MTCHAVAKNTHTAEPYCLVKDMYSDSDFFMLCLAELFALQRKSHLGIHFLGIARPQPQFQHSCVCERFI
jgi:hypothetical protein